MTRKVKENKAFADWLRDRIAAIQQNRPSVGHIVPENTASPDGQEYSDSADVVGSKLRVAFRGGHR